MTGYFLRRLLLIIPTFVGITLLVFAITRVVPGGPIERMMTQSMQQGEHGQSRSRSGNTLDEKQLEQLRAYYGFDKPIIVSYGQWLWRVLHLDLGSSTRYHDPVWSLIKERFPVSIFYGVTTLIITYGICIPLGIAKAVRHGKWFDNVSSIIVFLGYALPGYVDNRFSRLRAARLRCRYRADYIIRFAARLVSARRFRQRRFRYLLARRKNIRCLVSRCATTDCLSRGQLCIDHINDEKRIDGQFISGLHAHRGCERPELQRRSAQPCLAQQPDSDSDFIREQYFIVTWRIVFDRNHFQYRRDWSARLRIGT
jgi:hypothetical protein